MTTRLTSAGWLVPSWVGQISFWKAHPQAWLGVSGTQWPLRSSLNIRAAWSPSLNLLGSFSTLWSPFSSLGPNGNNKAFFRKKKKKKQRHHVTAKGPYSQSYGFFSSHIRMRMREWDNKQNWVWKSWCFWTVVLEKTLERPLDSKGIKPVNFKGINPEYSLKRLMLKLKLHYFGHLMQRAYSMEMRASFIAQLVKNPPAMQETLVRFLVRKICWRWDRLPTLVFLGFPCGSAGKESTCNAGDLGSIPGLGRSSG